MPEPIDFVIVAGERAGDIIAVTQPDKAIRTFARDRYDVLCGAQLPYFRTLPGFLLFCEANPCSVAQLRLQTARQLFPNATFTETRNVH